MRRLSVSTPVSSRAALCGDRQAPKSRKPSVRARMMKAAGPNSLGEDEAVIAGVGLGQRREAARRAPVETAAVDDARRR